MREIGRGHTSGKKCLRIRAQNYSGVRFIVPALGLMPIPSLDTGPAGDWEVDICR